MAIQDWMDHALLAARMTRSNYHLTLGELIKELSMMHSLMEVYFDHGDHVGKFDSYRGYYADLAISHGDSPITVEQFLADAKEALGKEFEGYKGGTFMMGEDTPLWNAPYGCCGAAIIGIDASRGYVRLLTKMAD